MTSTCTIFTTPAAYQPSEVQVKQCSQRIWYHRFSELWPTVEIIKLGLNSYHSYFVTKGWNLGGKNPNLIHLEGWTYLLDFSIYYQVAQGPPLEIFPGSKSVLHTPWKFKIESPLKISHPKRKVIFKPSGPMLNFGGVISPGFHLVWVVRLSLPPRMPVANEGLYGSPILKI